MKVWRVLALNGTSETHTTFIKTINISTIFRKSARIWQGGMGKVYMLPRIVTIESSLPSFQYKILNNILYLNEGLFKFNIVDSPLCSLCGAYNKSIKHLFCTCTVTQETVEST